MKIVAAIELADAILAEFNASDSKLKGFSTFSMEKLLAYRKVAERAPRGRKKALAEAEARAAAEEEADKPEPAPPA